MNEFETVAGAPPVWASPAEVARAYGWVVQIVHRNTLTGAPEPKLYGPFGDEDAAAMWMVSNGPEKTLFSVIPLFDRIW